MEYEEFLDNIKELASGLVEVYELKYKITKPVVMNIINNNITDKNIIEHCLDETLDIPTDKGFKLHSLLCSYYYTIDKESSIFYMNEYHNMWDNNEEEKWKDLKK